MDRVEMVKKFLSKMMPVMRAVANVTPTPLDDLAVQFLAAWVASGEPDLNVFAATYSPTA